MKFFILLILTVFSESHASDLISQDEILGFESIENYSVKKWGAVGDGQTDDLQSINRAIREQSSSGKVILYFPPGKYKVSDTIRITNAQKTIGQDLKFFVQGAGVGETEVFVTDKNKNTFVVIGDAEKRNLQGLFSDLVLGPERDSGSKGWPLVVKNLKRSSFKNISTRGQRCSLQMSNSGGCEFGNIQRGYGKQGPAVSSGCLGFDD